MILAIKEGFIVQHLVPSWAELFIHFVFIIVDLNQLIGYGCFQLRFLGLFGSLVGEVCPCLRLFGSGGVKLICLLMELLRH